MNKSFISRLVKELFVILLILFIGVLILQFLYSLGLKTVFSDVQMQLFNISLFAGPILYDSEGRNLEQFNIEILFKFILNTIFIVFISLFFYFVPIILNSDFTFLFYFSFFMYILVVFTIVKLIRSINK